jgi:predicted ATPase
MLTRLYATNYRCLVNFEFKPNAKQLIIGRNGSGKTTVFDVLGALRDFAVAGVPFEALINPRNGEALLGGRTRTRWLDAAEQRFELDVAGNGGQYRYTLVVDERGSRALETNEPGLARPSGGFIPESSSTHTRTRVKGETLEFNGMPLFRFQEGTIGLFNDRQEAKPNVEFRFDWGRSGLSIVEAGRRDNAKLTWFKRWLGSLHVVQINPWVMVARSEREARFPQRDLGNFADWYRHLRLESGDAVFRAISELREAMPGFEALDAKEAGLDVRVLQATLTGPNGQRIELPFHDLSEGQRTLIALYVLLHCAVEPNGMVLIDEPDNFIALAEIQPWLLKLLDRVDETNGQVMLVSHHPELLNQLADQGGVILDRPDGGLTRVLPFEPPEDSGLNAAEIVARGWELGESTDRE